MEHPWKILIEEIRWRWWTQKQFSSFVWKKNSEVNELIKWKRNITVQWDLILADVLGTPEKYWINLQVEYDYELAKRKYEEEKNSREIIKPEILGDDSWDWDIVNDNDIQKLPEIEIQKLWKDERQMNNWNDKQEKINDNNNQWIEKRRELKKIWIEF